MPARIGEEAHRAGGIGDAGAGRRSRRRHFGANQWRAARVCHLDRHRERRRRARRGPRARRGGLRSSAASAGAARGLGRPAAFRPGGVWAATSAARTDSPMRPVDTVSEARHEESRGRTNHAGNLHRSSRAAGGEGGSSGNHAFEPARLARRRPSGSDRRSRSSKSGRPSKPASRTVTVDAAVDDADHAPTSARRRRRPASAWWPRTIAEEVVRAAMPRLEPARRSRARHAEGAVERTTRVGYALQDQRRRSARRTPPPAARGACGRRPPSSRSRPSPSVSPRRRPPSPGTADSRSAAGRRAAAGRARRSDASVSPPAVRVASRA